MEGVNGAKGVCTGVRCVGGVLRAGIGTISGSKAMLRAPTFLPVGKMSISEKFQLLPRDAEKVEDGEDVDLLHWHPSTFRVPRRHPA